MVQRLCDWVSLVIAVPCIAISVLLAFGRSVESVSDPSKSWLVLWNVVLIAINVPLACRVNSNRVMQLCMDLIPMKGK